MIGLLVRCRKYIGIDVEDAEITSMDSESAFEKGGIFRWFVWFMCENRELTSKIEKDIESKSTNSSWFHMVSFSPDLE